MDRDIFEEIKIIPMGELSVRAPEFRSAPLVSTLVSDLTQMAGSGPLLRMVFIVLIRKGLLLAKLRFPKLYLMFVSGAPNLIDYSLPRQLRCTLFFSMLMGLTDQRWLKCMELTFGLVLLHLMGCIEMPSQLTKLRGALRLD